MFEWLATLQFGAPLSFLAAALAPLLIYAYLRRNPQRERKVSSVLILKELPRRTPIKRRFRPPLRFFLELLALLLLCFAAAIPSRRQPDERVAVIIDNSLSMQATDNGGGAIETRIHQAISAAIIRISEFSSTARFTIYTSSPKLARVGDEDLSEKGAESTLKDISATYAGDTLETSVSELASSNDFDRVIVVSDKKAEFDSVTNESAQTSLEKNSVGGNRNVTRIEGLQIGARAANIFITNFAMARSGIGGEGEKLVASIGYSGPGDESAVVTFSEIEAGQEQQLGTVNVTLQPDRGAEASWSISGSGKFASVYRASVRALSSQNAMSSDAIAADNSAWLSNRGDAQGKLLLVEGLATDSSLGLGTIPGISVETIDAKSFSERSEADLEKYAVLIFHRTAPLQAPKRPTLLILPPATNPIFPGLREENESKISSWSTDHPLTSYLRPQLFRFGHVMLFDTPLWATSILNVERGSVMVAGESRGVRFAAVGFELLPFEAGKTPTLSILSLNLLNWLSGSSEIGAGNLSGSSLRLEPGKYQITAPNGTQETLSSSSQEPSLVALSEPGIYRIQALGNVTAAEERNRLIAVNSLYPEESATYMLASYQAVRTVEHEEIAEKGSSSLWPFILAAALAFLLLEMLFRFRPEKAAIRA